MLELILIILLWGFLFLQLLLLISYISIRFEPIKDFKKFDSNKAVAVSILVAARNEASHIITCLESINRLHYPKELLKVFIGNDQSTDETATLVSKYIEDKPHFQLVQIQENLGSARAKGNVLAQLMKLVQTEYVFVTDADIQVNPDWIQRMLPKLEKEKHGMVSGTTLVKGPKLFHQWQGLEWLLGTGYIAAFHHLGIPTTAVGNNMAFTKAAYEATGGYENMPFSVTEDFQLYAAMRKLGYATYNESHPQSLHISAAQTQVKSFLHQRKRWLMGALALPWYWSVLFGLQGLYYPCLFLLFFLHISLALKIFIIKFVLQHLFLAIMQYRLNQKPFWLAQLSFELYNIWSIFSSLVFFYGQQAMDWKGRKYV